MSELKEQKTPDRIIGILGGMGPEATLDLYRHIIALTPAGKDQDHIRVLIYSNPKIPDRTKAIAEGSESPLPLLIESVKLLERSGAGIIAMPCNTAHHFLAQMQHETNIQILNMIEETCRTLSRDIPEARTVGLLAAAGTVRSGMYARILTKAGVRVLIPKDPEQNRIQAAIAQVKAGIHDQSTREIFESVGRQLVKEGAEAIVLGCTEIPLAVDANRADYPCLNSTRILAQAAVDWALGIRE